MDIWITIPIIACLLCMFYQDLKERAIYVVLFGICFPLVIVKALITGSFSEFSGNALISISYLTCVLIPAYFIIKFRNKKHPQRNIPFLGAGDVLFMYLTTLILPPLVFAAFLLGTILAVLIIYIFRKNRSHWLNNSIPLAGIQAFSLSVILILDVCFTFFSIDAVEYKLMAVILFY